MAKDDKKPSAAELEAKLAQLEEENKILRDNKVTKKNDYTGMPVEGSLEVALEDTQTGKTKKQKVAFVPGAVWCRVATGEKVWSEDLMALANGATLTEESIKRSPDLASMDESKAGSWIATLARRGATFLRTVSGMFLMLIIMMSTTVTVDAQNFRNGHQEFFTLDTLINATSITFLPSKSSTGMDEYDYYWQVTSTNISGTTAGSIIVEESIHSSGDYWTPVDTVAVATGSLLLSGQLGAVRQRIRIVGTGTQSSQIRVAALFRKRNF